MLQPTDTTAIPAMTHLVAHAAFPNGSVAIRLRDAFGPLFNDAAFAELYPTLGQPAASPARLALITILQFVEDLPDRQAADAVRARIDWKYALGLELSDPGFHYSVLSEFRQRLVTHEKAQLLLHTLLDHCTTHGLLEGKRMQRTDSIHVLAAVRSLTLVELVGETMRRALNALAQVAPTWLQLHLPPEWIKRYGRRFDSSHFPKGEAQRTALAEQIGRDGVALLKAIWADGTPPAVRALPSVDVLRRIWIQQFYIEAETVHWRPTQQWGPPPARLLIASPEDREASSCVQRSTAWTGDKVPCTATGAPDHPRLITDVATTPATTHDVKMTAAIQDNLAARPATGDAFGGRRLHGHGSAGHESAQRHRPRWPHPLTQKLAVPHGGCVRPHPVHDRLGGEASALSGRTHECTVCGTHNHTRDAQRAVCLSPGGLPAMSAPRAVYACRRCGPHIDGLSPGTV